MSRNGSKNGKSLNGAKSSGSAHSANTLVEVKPKADDVRQRAYELYLRRMAAGQPGDAASDWSIAERELAAK